MKKINSSNRSEDQSGPDLTPMLDVVFIMLIFFIVTATFLTEKSIPVHQPDSSPTEENDNTSLVMRIDGSNRIYMGPRQIDVGAVRALVAQYLAENSEGSVMIQADEMASVEKYVAVANEVRKVREGIVSLGVVSSANYAY